MMEWLIAFLVHSTLWCGLAWLWLCLRPNSHARVRETIWYTAIAASFITPTAQTFYLARVRVLAAAVAESGCVFRGRAL